MLMMLLQIALDPFVSWFPIAAVGAIAIIAIFSLIYALSPFLGNAANVRIWSKIKIFETVLALALMAIFLIFINLFQNAAVTQAYTSAGYVPSSCQASADLTTLAICNINYFSQTAANLNGQMFLAGLLISFAPSPRLSTSSIIQTPVFEASTILKPASTGPDDVIGMVLGVTFPFYVLSRIQVYLLSASLILFPILMIIGMLSRIFVITRSFGGAMIALAMGLGLIYPMLAALMYGFIDVQVQALNFSALTLIFPIAALLSPAAFMILASIPSVGPAVALIGASAIFAGGAAGLWISLTPIIVYAGNVALGLIFVPMFVFLLVDIFVIDFSKTLGQQTDFMSLLTGMI